MRLGRILTVVGLLALILTDAEAAFADSFTLLVSPGPGGIQPQGINDVATIVGQVFGPGAAQTGFVYQAGMLTMLNPPGSSGSIAYGINNSGTVVGEAFYTTGARGFVWNGGNYTILSVPGSHDTVFQGINDLGQIVGWTNSPSNPNNTGFIYSSGVFSPFNVPGSLGTIPVGINDRGQIAGFSYGPVAGNFIFGSSDFLFLTPPGNGPTVLGINNLGYVVGYYQTNQAPYFQSGFLYNGTQYIPVAYPTQGSSIVTGLNDKNTVAGFITNGPLGGNGFIAQVTPVPEPGTFVLFGTGFAGLFLSRRKARV